MKVLTTFIDEILPSTTMIAVLRSSFLSGSDGSRRDLDGTKLVALIEQTCFTFADLSSLPFLNQPQQR